MIINGREYPLWSQFVENQHKWVGGILEDFGDSFDSMINPNHEKMSTKITSINLLPNGDDSAFFEVIGEDFSCGFDVKYGGIGGGETNSGWLTFNGYGGHTWRIKQPEKNK